MLSDEEKKAIDIIKNEIKSFETVITAMEKEIDDKDWLRKNILEIKEDISVRETLLNLIEKQSKEIEELKEKKEELEKIVETYNVMPNKYTPNNMKLVIADMEYFKDGFFKENMIPKSKIEAKIEEIKEEVKTCSIYKKTGLCTNNCKEDCEYYDFIDILQSLLEKE